MKATMTVTSFVNGTNRSLCSGQELVSFVEFEGEECTDQKMLEAIKTHTDRVRALHELLNPQLPSIQEA